MKIKATLLLIFAVLVMMLGAGGASAYIAYLMGREALKVVTQPDTDSKQNLSGKSPVGGSHKGLKIIEERSVIINVYDRIQRKKDPNYVEQSFDRDKPKPNTPSVIQSDRFPMKDSSRGVTLEVSQAKIERNSVMLDVNLTNEGTEAVRFLYSFLDIRDDGNRPLSAIADGLPGEIPPNGKPVWGQFIIPMTLLENSQQISLTLQDYPDQTITLKLQSIPITR